MAAVICPDCDASFDADSEVHRCLGPERVERRRLLECELRALESKLASIDASLDVVKYSLAITAVEDEIIRQHGRRRRP